MMRSRWGILVLVAAMAGLFFSAVSAYDSVVHLDRQIHGIHCSYLLGLGSTDASGSSGCYTTLMSPYSSLWREAIWGGIPIALPAMSVFCFIMFWTLWLLLSDRHRDRRAAGFLFTATALPLLSSAVMAYLSFVTLGAACKLCIGIYASSAAAFAFAAGVFLQARKSSAARPAEGNDQPRLLSRGALLAAFGVGVLFVAVPVLTYAAVAPDFSRYVGNCGTLQQPRRAPDVLISLGQGGGKVEVIEVIDPLCGACKIFDQRFTAMQEARRVRRELLLFPLDNECNWMVEESVHPGACTASEALLCAGDRAKEVLGWIFAQQDEILESARRDPKAVRQLLTQRFPALGGCLGTPPVRARLNRALRWTVSNRLQVLTPQVFVNGLRLCDEDTDLGMEYAISRLIARARAAPGARPEPAAPAGPSEPAAPGTRSSRRPRERLKKPPREREAGPRAAGPAPAGQDAGPAGNTAPAPVDLPGKAPDASTADQPAGKPAAPPTDEPPPASTPPATKKTDPPAAPKTDPPAAPEETP
jgi:uncharacterized membrane protein